MSHFKFDIMMMVGCLLFAARLVSFWQSSGVHPIDIHVDFFPVSSTSTMIMANQMNLCSNIPHLCTVSILNKATWFKDFHGSNCLIYLYLCVILCGNFWDIESNPGPDSCNGSSHFPCGVCDAVVGWEDRGIFRRNLAFAPRSTKEVAYKTLVRPKLEYAAPIWSPYSNFRLIR